MGSVREKRSVVAPSRAQRATAPSPGVGALRAARVLVLAVVVVALSAGLHGLAGGPHPGAGPLAVVTALVAMAVWPLTRRQLGLAWLGGALGVGQIGMHVALTQWAQRAPVTSDLVHDHHGAAPHVPMIAAHVVATFASALVLRHGEALLWRAWAWLTRPRLMTAPSAVVGTAARAAWRDLVPEHAAPAGHPGLARAPPATA